MTWIYFLDLQDDPTRIAEYERHHRAVWPEVLTHLRQSGIQRCRIYRAGNRLTMLLDSDRPVATDGGNEPVSDRVMQWETLMDQFQQRLPFAGPGEKWVQANSIFDWSSPESSDNQ